MTRRLGSLALWVVLIAILALNASGQQVRVFADDSPKAVNNALQLVSVTAPNEIFLFQQGSPARLTYAFKSGTDRDWSGICNFDISDRTGQSVDHVEMPLYVASGKTEMLEPIFDISRWKFDVYEISMTAAHDHLPESPIISSRDYFGVCSGAKIGKAVDGEFLYGLDLGLPEAWDRESAWKWTEVMGVDILRSSDYYRRPTSEMIEKLQRFGLQGMFLNAGRPPAIEDLEQLQRNLQDRVKEVERLARDTRGKITYWELGNEPDFYWFYKAPMESYVAGYHEIAQAIRRGNPNAKIMNGGLYCGGYHLHERTRYFLEHVDPSLIDYLAYHAHGEGVEAERRMYEAVKAGLDRSGNNDIPLVQTESGMNADTPEQADAQAATCIQKMVFAQSTEMPFFIWFRLCMENGRGYSMVRFNPQDKWESLQPRPSILAYRTMVETLRGRRFQKMLDLGHESLEAYLFAEYEGPRRACVLWMNEPMTIGATLDVASTADAVHDARTIDMYGNTNEARVFHDGRIQVSVSERPVFVAWSTDEPTYDVRRGVSDFAVPPILRLPLGQTRSVDLQVHNPLPRSIDAAIDFRVGAEHAVQVEPESQQITLKKGETKKVSVDIAAQSADSSQLWPKRWTVFADTAPDYQPAQWSSIPDMMPGHSPGQQVTGRTCFLVNDRIDIARLAGGFREKATAWCFTEVESPIDQTIRVGAAADFWMVWYVNGQQVYSTLEEGNGDQYNVHSHTFNVPLRKGKNLVACEVLSGSWGWAFITGGPEALKRGTVRNELAIRLTEENKTVLQETINLEFVKPLRFAADFFHESLDDLEQHDPDAVLSEKNIENYWFKLPDNSRWWNGVNDLSALVWLGMSRDDVCLTVAVRDDVSDCARESDRLLEFDSLRVAVETGSGEIHEFALGRVNDAVMLYTVTDNAVVTRPVEQYAHSVIRDHGVTQYRLGLPCEWFAEGHGRINIRINDSDDDFLKQSCVWKPGWGDKVDAGKWFEFLLPEQHLLDDCDVATCEDSTNDRIDEIPHLTPIPVAVNATDDPVIQLTQWQVATLLSDGDPLNPPVSVEWRSLDITESPAPEGIHLRSPQAVAKATVQIPADWAGLRIRLRRYGGKLFVNGRPITLRDELFPPYEDDVTDWIHPGQPNEIVLVWENEKINDLIAKLEPVCLFAVPSSHVEYLYITPHFDRDFRDASLQIRTAIVAEADASLPAGTLLVELLAPNGKVVQGVHPQAISTPQVLSGQTEPLRFELNVPQPRKWHPEHPDLYTLRLTLQPAGETVSERIGFRQIDIDGSTLLLNGKPHKIRGVHMSMLLNLAGDPRNGELSPPPTQLSRQALRTLRDANVNSIRSGAGEWARLTSMYDDTDRLGLTAMSNLVNMTFIGKGRWEGMTATQKEQYLDRMERGLLEVAASEHNHPSVIVWEIANESDWQPEFTGPSEALREFDPSRPRNFTWHHYRRGNSTPELTELADHHYPYFDMPLRARNREKPTMYGEMASVPSLSADDQWDAGALDYHWGKSFDDLWQRIEQYTGNAGGYIYTGSAQFTLEKRSQWAAGRPVNSHLSMIDVQRIIADEMPLYDNSLLDGWFRPRAPLYHVKKSYSPIRVQPIAQFEDSGVVVAQVESRMEATDLSQLHIDWALLNELGAVVEQGVASASDRRGDLTGELRMTPKVAPAIGQSIELTFHSPLGYEIDRHLVSVGAIREARLDWKTNDEPVQVTVTPQQYRIDAADTSWVFDRSSGRLVMATKAGETVLTDGPVFSIGAILGRAAQKDREPMPNPPIDQPRVFDFGEHPDWHVQACNIRKTDQGAVLHVEGQHDLGLLAYDFSIDGAGQAVLDYEFTPTETFVPRQLGWAFELPETHQTLLWRNAPSAAGYPTEFIGRQFGIAKATRSVATPGRLDDYTKRPDFSWQESQLPFGTFDFASAKQPFRWAALVDTNGYGVEAIGVGQQSVRAYVDDGKSHMMIAGINNGPESRWPGLLTRKYRLTLVAGQTFSASHRLNLVKLPLPVSVCGSVERNEGREQEQIVRELSARYWHTGGAGVNESDIGADAAQDNGLVESEWADFDTAAASAVRQILAIGVGGISPQAGDTVVLAVGRDTDSGQWQSPSSATLERLLDRDYRVLPVSAGRYNQGSGTNPPSWNLKQGGEPVIFLGLELVAETEDDPPRYRVCMEAFSTSHVSFEAKLLRDEERWRLKSE